MSIFDNLFSKLPGKKKSKIPAKKEEHASIHSFEAKKREKEESANSCKDAVSYKHIDREFGTGFLFSPERMQAEEREIDFFTSGIRHDMEEKFQGTDITIFESTKYRRIVRFSRSVPTFDSDDREYDSWRDLYLLQEHNGIIRAVYCTGGYKIACVEGYAQVYQYPKSLEKYFQDAIPQGKSVDVEQAANAPANPPVQKEPHFKLGDGFYFEFNEVPNGMGGYRMINVYLLKTDNPSFRRCIVDERGMIENFPGIVEGDWKKSLEFPLDRKTQFRFWIYHYKDGKAAVEWMLQPDGRYFEDEDGFGGENCKEVTLHSYIDTNGFFTEPFK